MNETLSRWLAQGHRKDPSDPLEQALRAGERWFEEHLRNLSKMAKQAATSGELLNIRQQDREEIQALAALQGTTGRARETLLEHMELFGPEAQDLIQRHQRNLRETRWVGTVTDPVKAVKNRPFNIRRYVEKPEDIEARIRGAVRKQLSKNIKAGRTLRAPEKAGMKAGHCTAQFQMDRETIERAVARLDPKPEPWQYEHLIIGSERVSYPEEVTLRIGKETLARELEIRCADTDAESHRIWRSITLMGADNAGIPGRGNPYGSISSLDYLYRLVNGKDSVTPVRWKALAGDPWAWRAASAVHEESEAQECAAGGEPERDAGTAPWNALYPELHARSEKMLHAAEKRAQKQREDEELNRRLRGAKDLQEYWEIAKERGGRKHRSPRTKPAGQGAMALSP